MRIDNKRGTALVYTLFFVVNLLILQIAFVSMTTQGARMSRLECDSSKALFSAQGGAQAALEMIDTLINGYLQNTIMSADPSGVAADAKNRVNTGDGIGWLVNATRDNNEPVLAVDGDEAIYYNSGTAGSVPYAYSITFAEKSEPVLVQTDVWEFSFVYLIVSNSSLGSLNKQIVVNGDFTVRVQKDNFAKFSLFTNRQQMPDGTNVWFTNNTSFYGPVHTNDRYNFALNPSGSFAETVTQGQQTARYYNNNFPVLLDASANGTLDVPSFDKGFTRGADQITLSAATAEADMKDAATNKKNYSNNGIYLPSSNGTLTGGIYVKGNGSVALSVNGLDQPVYTVTQGASTYQITVDSAGNNTSVLNTSNGSSTTYTGMPNGTSSVGTLIFVDGNIDSFSGTVQKDTQVTVASHNDLVITNNVRYANYTPASGTPGTAGYVPPSAAGTDNLLGLVSWNGNVRIGTAAPDNVDVHGTVMAAGGVFSVDNYNQGSPRGKATLLGGAITNNYGAFGQFNSQTGQMITGYGRSFIYDTRMQEGMAPPYFPSLKTFIAFTNDITDKLVWQEMN